MRLYRLQSSPGTFLVATRSSHSPLPSTWATLVVERIRSECRPSLTWTSVNVISPRPANDQVKRSSMLSSTRESRTFLFSQRNSAPSSSLACMGISGTICCAVREVPRETMQMQRAVAMPIPRALPIQLLHLDLVNMIEPCTLHAITTQPVDLRKLRVVLSLPENGISWVG